MGGSMGAPIEIAGFEPSGEVTCMGQRHLGFTALSGSGTRIELAQAAMSNDADYRRIVALTGYIANFIDRHGLLDGEVSDEMLAALGLARLQLGRDANEGWLYTSTKLAQPVVVKQRHGAGADVQHYGQGFIAPTLAEKSTWLRAPEPYAMIMLANHIGLTIVRNLSGYQTIDKVLDKEAIEELLSRIEAEAERIFGRTAPLMRTDMGIRLVNDVTAANTLVADTATAANLGDIYIIDQPAADIFGNLVIAIRTIAELDPDFQPNAWASIIDMVAKMS